MSVIIFYRNTSGKAFMQEEVLAALFRMRQPAGVLFHYFTLTGYLAQ